MSFTSNCPKCQKPITIPDSVGPAALVRCPLCDEQYPLGEALALAPPALIVVAGGEEAPLAASATELPPVTLSDEAAANSERDVRGGGPVCRGTRIARRCFSTSRSPSQNVQKTRKASPRRKAMQTTGRPVGQRRRRGLGPGRGSRR